MTDALRYENSPPPWFYVGILVITVAIAVIAPYEKEIIKFWAGL